MRRIEKYSNQLLIKFRNKSIGERERERERAREREREIDRCRKLEILYSLIRKNMDIIDRNFKCLYDVYF